MPVTVANRIFGSTARFYLPFSSTVLLRLQGERHIYKTAQPFTVCSGMDESCVTQYEMLDIGMLFKLHSGMDKLIRLSVRINSSSSCDLIVGRRSLHRHNLYRFIPGAFGEHYEDPKIPFDDLRWINDSNKRKRLVENTGILPVTSVTATTAVTGERQLNDILDQSLQATEEAITPSQTQVDVTAIPTAPGGSRRHADTDSITDRILCR